MASSKELINTSLFLGTKNSSQNPAQKLSNILNSWKEKRMSKLPNVGTTIFTVMSKMANDYAAINLSQGFPNFPVDPKLTACLVEAAKNDVHQYAPMAGHPLLLEEIAKLTKEQYNRTIDPTSELLVTAGATQAIFSAIQAIVKADEEVLILDPSYDCYEPPVILTGAKSIRIPLTDAFQPDWNRIRESIRPNTKMLIINNPHNPSGSILDQNDMHELTQIMLANPQLVLLSDEVYEYITFEEKHLSANTIRDLHDRTIIVSSFGKTFHITGWKIGYLIGPEHLIKEIKKVHQFLVFCVNSPAQVSLASYLNQTNVAELGAFYQQKRDYFRSGMEQTHFRLLPSQGTYFQLADYSAISDESDLDFCERLVKEYGVAAIPLSVFNANQEDRKLIRFCFAKTNETIEKAIERLCKI